MGILSSLCPLRTDFTGEGPNALISTLLIFFRGEVPYTTVLSLASPYVDQQNNDEAIKHVLTCALTSYEWYLLVKMPDRIESVRKTIKIEPPKAQDCDAVLDSRDKLECLHIYRQVEGLNDEEWVAEFVYVEDKGPLVYYAVKIFPHPLLGATRLQEMYYRRNPRQHRASLPPPPPPPSLGQGPGPKPKPLIKLRFPSDILKWWPDPSTTTKRVTETVEEDRNAVEEDHPSTVVMETQSNAEDVKEEDHPPEGWCQVEDDMVAEENTGSS